MSLKVRILQFFGSNDFDQKFHCNFFDQGSISFLLKTFYKILLTWSKNYYSTAEPTDQFEIGWA